MAALEDATLVEAMAAILGVTWILAMFGITVATTETKVEVAKVEVAKVAVAATEAKAEVAKVEVVEEPKAPATREDKKAKK